MSWQQQRKGGTLLRPSQCFTCVSMTGWWSIFSSNEHILARHETYSTTVYATPLCAAYTVRKCVVCVFGKFQQVANQPFTDLSNTPFSAGVQIVCTLFGGSAPLNTSCMYISAGYWWRVQTDRDRVSSAPMPARQVEGWIYPSSRSTVNCSLSIFSSNYSLAMFCTTVSLGRFVFSFGQSPWFADSGFPYPVRASTSPFPCVLIVRNIGFFLFVLQTALRTKYPFARCSMMSDIYHWCLVKLLPWASLTQLADLIRLKSLFLEVSKLHRYCT